MISKEELDRLRQYLKYNVVEGPFVRPDWYSLNGLTINIGDGAVFVYLSRDKWLVACTEPGYGTRNNPHGVIVTGFDGLMRLLAGGEMAYSNMENELILDGL